MGTMIAVLARSPYPVAGLHSSQLIPGGFADETDGGDGWQVAFSDHQPPDLDAAVQSYVRETGCPALIALIIEGQCAIVFNAIPGGPGLIAVLGLRTAVSGGIDLAEYQPDETKRELLAWAATAGTMPRPELLDTVLFHDGGEDLGIKLLAGLLGGLGIPDFRGADPFGEEQVEKVIGGPKQQVDGEAVMLVRSSTQISNLHAARAWPGGWHGKEQKFKKGWRAASSGEWPDDIPGALNAFATETQGPALLAITVDAGFVIVKGTSRPGHFWETIVGLDAAHDVGHCTNYDDSDTYRFYKESRTWSADAGLTSDDQKLRAAYERSGGLGEEMPLLFVLFSGLGIPGCENIPSYWDGSELYDPGGWVIVPSIQITF